MKRTQILYVLAALIVCLNSADYGLTVYLTRTGLGWESNPVMRTPGMLELKALLVPVLVGLVWLQLAQAERRKPQLHNRTLAHMFKIDLVFMAGAAAFLAVVVSNNLGVLVFHQGITNLLGV